MKRDCILVVLAALFAFVLTSCDSSLFDDEGNCEVSYKIRFVYDRNLKWADAFPSEVNSVNLYAFDSEGVFVKEFIGRGEALSQPNYYMTLDLPAGNYKFVAWCGLANEEAEEESFTVPQPISGVTTIDELTCSLNTRNDAVNAHCSDKQLYFLYHGYLEANLPDSQDGAEYVYTVYLTKDTNHIRIILHELDGDVHADDYDFRIEAANGFMAYDNALLGNAKIAYMPWNLQTDEIGVGKSDGDGSLMSVKGAMADLSVGRMMAEHKNEMLLTITSKKNQETIIAKVPVIQYALLSKDYYEMAYGHNMTEQEFLDREDEYVLTFFLLNGKWIDSYIYIHSWRVVLHEYELGA